MMSRPAKFLSVFLLLCVGMVGYQYWHSRNLAGRIIELEAIAHRTEATLQSLRDGQPSMVRSGSTEPLKGQIPQGIRPGDAQTEQRERPLVVDAKKSWKTGSVHLFVPKAHLSRLEISPVSSTNEVTQVMMDALGMSEVERTRVSQAFQDYLSRFQDIERDLVVESGDHAGQAAQHEGEKTTFVIPPFAENGADLERSLEESVMQSLGASRGELFMAQMDSVLRRRFSDSGAQGRRITFVDQPQPDGTSKYRIITESFNDQGHSLGLHDETSSDGGIPERFQHLIGFESVAADG